MKTGRRRRKHGRPRGPHRKLGFETLDSRRVLASLLDGVVVAAGEGEGDPMPDFSLTDENESSPTFNQQVSPRDFQGAVSGWYFGHAT